MPCVSEIVIEIAFDYFGDEEPLICITSGFSLVFIIFVKFVLLFLIILPVGCILTFVGRVIIFFEPIVILLPRRGTLLFSIEFELLLRPLISYGIIPKL